MSDAAAILEISPFDDLLGLALREAEGDSIAGVVEVRPELTQPIGMVHGGVYAAIAEGLASLATNRRVAERGAIALGQSNACTFLRPISGGQIHALARPCHRGISTWVWDVEMSDDAGRICAVSRVTIAVRQRGAR